MLWELALVLLIAAAAGGAIDNGRADGDGVGDDTMVACTSGEDGIGDAVAWLEGPPRDDGDGEDGCDDEEEEDGTTKLFWFSKQ